MLEKQKLVDLFHRFLDLFSRCICKLTLSTLLILFFFLLTLILLFIGDDRPTFIPPQLYLFNSITQSAQVDLPLIPSPTSLEHILFGIGGSFSSWPQRRSCSELWWQPNKTRGYVWFDEVPTPTPFDSKVPTYKQSEDSSRFSYTCPYDKHTGMRLSRILVKSVKLKEKGVRWYVMGDDDTIFFTENLVVVLNKYDHNQMYYIGGVSESVEQDIEHSYDMAFGGDGFAISAVLAEELVHIFDGCLYRYSSLYGSDQRVGTCVSELGVPFTIEPGFH